MKDNLFEMLMNLFEKSLSQLKKSHRSLEQDQLTQLIDEEDNSDSEEEPIMHISKSPQQTSTRIFTYEEQIKLTKASYQFLMKMKQLGVIDGDLLELIMNQLLFSESRIVTLQETKWAIKSILAANLNEEQITFLDLVLDQTDKSFAVH